MPIGKTRFSTLFLHISRKIANIAVYSATDGLIYRFFEAKILSISPISMYNNFNISVKRVENG